jgi:hypothetical protein
MNEHSKIILNIIIVYLMILILINFFDYLKQRTHNSFLFARTIFINFLIYSNHFPIDSLKLLSFNMLIILNPSQLLKFIIFLSILILPFSIFIIIVQIIIIILYINFILIILLSY